MCRVMRLFNVFEAPPRARDPRFTSLPEDDFVESFVRLQQSGRTTGLELVKMNGCLIPNTPFAVDFWKSRQSEHTRLFFLTHMHADHTSGLSPSWKHPIYCSDITAKLLIHKFNIAPALVHTLEVGESHILALDETGQETMTVTVFDANHCPGAVMFLFQGYFGSIFYTGDFRYSPEMFDHEALANKPSIDVLYLDNTYCSPECKFPSRTQATQMIKDIISRHPEHDIILGMTMLGKEDMLVELAKTFQTWVVVTPQRLETLKQLELPNVFTTDPEGGRIRVALKYQITRKNLEKWNQERPTIAILPSALFTGLNGKPYANQPDVHIVPYSDHSSYRELHEFVSRLKPRSIIPVVKGTSRGVFGTSLQGRADMHCFDNYLESSAKRTFQIPESVRKFMFRGSHSSVVDVFADKACERKGKSSRNCVSATRGRPMGVVFIDSPQSTPEKTKCQHVGAPENESMVVCVDGVPARIVAVSVENQSTVAGSFAVKYIVFLSSTLEGEYILHITRKKHPTLTQYSLCGEALTGVKSHPYIGVQLSDDLRWDTHINHATSKAGRVLGVIRRNLTHCPSRVKATCYKALVRPHLEYSAIVWDPYTTKGIQAVEAVQRRAARVTLND
ncbi:DCLRE1B [Branchiostoma lanceolatum]|uniref:5' exonuclease Apollo n=1 Tax=Branchiostoma lanceolatum TaxID=7740 RepID=A0A8K0A1Q4_BRALA|nr:DCLRE1B [Branchiostoma lanceolatum]